MSSSVLTPVSVAARGKGASGLLRRARTIGARYGVTAHRMEGRLAVVLEIVERHGRGATLPITAAAVERHGGEIARYAERGIEFAVHGYRHVDHAGLGAAAQVSELGRARRILQAHGVPALGFRAPYLRWNEGTLQALRENGFLYDSSQAIHWPIDPTLDSGGYRRALAFYGALSANEHLSLPRLDRGVVRIPCAIPDDEAAVDRLQLRSSDQIADVWLDVFRRTHERGELFTLAVHPERIDVCGPAIAAVLDAASTARSAVWIARLDELARWWQARAGTNAVVHEASDDGRWRVDVRGPEGLVVLAHNVEVPGAERIAEGTVCVTAERFDVRSDIRPVVAVHPGSPPALRTFLRDQGYLVEIAPSPDGYGSFVHRDRFSPEDELPLVRELESSRAPLLRLGRWPRGARSALSITGDVDALTIWDYALRFVGR
jgi:peptidoglycan/xylan/chitin deacetylase (PgdA/CDA1 family)